MKNVVVMVSGGGTNLQAIIDAVRNGKIKNARIAGVISNNPNAYALQRAEKANIKTKCITRKDYPGVDDFNEALLNAVDSFAPDLIVLAGFLVIVPKTVIKKYRNKVINIHPSLIPKYCGKGFYGLKVHEEVLKNKEKITGATVHYVDEGIDTGKIIIQKEVEVLEGDTPEALQRRVMENAEWKILPMAIDKIVNEKKAKVLVIGSGGREHAIVLKLAQSEKVGEIYCIPGNPGIAEHAECIQHDINDFEWIADFAEKKKTDLTVAAMDELLYKGIVDVFEKHNLKIFGPNKKAAYIEGSKVFAKELMIKNNIPTAKYANLDNCEKAKEYIKKADYPLVLKADGLAAGKGVFICKNEAEALEAIDILMVEKRFKDAGARVVAEEYLEGTEISVLTFTDGKCIKVMPSAKDYKRAQDGDMGENTGGMGNVSPNPYFDKDTEKECMEKIFMPTVNAMNKEGRPFKGVIFFGLIKTPKGVYVLEYNARFGDPETQVVLPRMKNDLFDVMNACINGELEKTEIETETKKAVCVVLTSKGYPGKYTTGKKITGIKEAEKGAMVIHAGTAQNAENEIVTSGGRVLNVVVLDDEIEGAIANAYKAAEKISFEGCTFRKDIGRDMLS